MPLSIISHIVHSNPTTTAKRPSTATAFRQDIRYSIRNRAGFGENLLNPNRRDYDTALSGHTSKYTGKVCGGERNMSIPLTLLD